MDDNMSPRYKSMVLGQARHSSRRSPVSQTEEASLRPNVCDLIVIRPPLLYSDCNRTIRLRLTITGKSEPRIPKPGHRCNSEGFGVRIIETATRFLAVVTKKGKKED